MSLPSAAQREIDRLNRTLELQATLLEQIARQQSEQMHARPYREWEPWRAVDGFTLTGGATSTAALGFGSLGNPLGGGYNCERLRAPNGWEVKVGRVLISATGASSGGIGGLYLNVVDDTSLAAFFPGFAGASPSRAESDNAFPFYLADSDLVILQVAGVAPNAQVTIRVEGERRAL